MKTKQFRFLLIYDKMIISSGLGYITEILIRLYFPSANTSFVSFLGDSFSNHNNMKFTTFDKDQDAWDKNCAQHYLGGFWYNACHTVNPNGMYAPHGAIGFENVHVIWHGWRGWNYSLKTIAMKIRSVAKCVCNHQLD